MNRLKIPRGRNIFRLFLALGAACIISGSLNSAPAGAISDYGPDVSEFSNGRYVLANSANTGDQSSIRIPIYYTGRNNPGSTTVRIYDVARYAAMDQAIVVNSDFRARYISDASVSIGGFSWHSETGTWRSEVTFKLVNGSANSASFYYQNRIAFRLDVDNGFLVGNATGGSSGLFNIIAANPSHGLGTLNYSVQFATPCNIQSDTFNAISLFDLDSGTSDNENNSIVLSITDVTSGGGVSYAPSGGMGQNQTYYLGMTFQPGHKYILHINNVSHINLIQYKFPYDNASYVTGCPVSPKYSLSPSTSVTPGVAEAGETVTASSSVSNSGPTTSGNVGWQLTKIIVPAGVSVPNAAGGSSNLSPCGGYFNQSGVNCSLVTSGTSQFQTNGVVTGDSLTSHIAALDDIPAGSRLCFALSVNPRTSDTVSDQWAHARPACVIVSKKPKVQVLGGDLAVGGLIATSTSAKSGLLYGSWSEYLVTAKGTISGMASARGYAGGASSAPFCSVSYLTLTNSGSGACSNSTPKGGYSKATNSPGVSSVFTNASPLGTNPTIDVTTQAGGVYSATGTVTVRASQPALGSRAIIINAPTARVVITDNIRYASGPYTSVSDIPQLVIIADSISIEGDVSQVDAWLIAAGSGGTISTCSEIAVVTSLTTQVCSQKLTVNGPVYAKKLLLFRTAGSGTGVASGEPGEVFNLRPDAYLWLSAYQSSAIKARTVITKELPPRY